MVDMECRYLRRLGADGDVDILSSDDFLLLAVVNLDSVGIDKSCSALDDINAAGLLPQQSLKTEA